MTLGLPDDPAVYEAVGTVGAFVIALAIYASSLADRRRVQASRISAWVALGPAPDHAPELHMLNTSDQPVHHLHVRAVATPRSESVQEVPTVLPPGETVVPANVGALGIVGYLQDMPAPVALVFTDSMGRRWHRLDQYGRLTRCRRWHRHAWD